MKTRTMFLVPILSVAGLLFAIPCFPGVPPLREDSDKDSLCNKCEEEIFGTNPSKIDTDDDRIPDGDEDHDGDGLTNLEELNNIVALMDAIDKGDTEGVIALLDYGPYLVIVSYQGTTPLMRAAQIGRIEVVNVLLQARVDVHERDKYGDTALSWAASDGPAEVVQILVQAGADVNAKNKYGVTALMFAARDGRTEAVKILLEARANVNEVSDMGFTPLDRAASSGHTDIVKILLNAGAEW